MDNRLSSNHSTQCQCSSVTIGIPGPTLVNMPRFHNFVRSSILPLQKNPQKLAIQSLKDDGIHVLFNSAQFSKCTVAATKCILGVLVPIEFDELHSFLHLLARKNKKPNRSFAIRGQFEFLFLAFRGFSYCVGGRTVDYGRNGDGLFPLKIQKLRRRRDAYSIADGFR
jgi:hypothetical protein